MIKNMIKFTILFFRNLFIPARIPSVQSYTKTFDPQPYREESPAPDHDGLHCIQCMWLKKNGIWKPPDIILTAGFPIECLLFFYKMTTLKELDELAKKCGLKVIKHTRCDDGVNIRNGWI